MLANKMKKSNVQYNKQNVPNTTIELGAEFSGHKKQHQEQVEEMKKQKNNQ